MQPVGANEWHGSLAVGAQAELLDLAHDAIFVRDFTTGTIRYWNRGAEELYGWSRGEALNSVSHQLLHTEFPEPFDQLEATLIRTGHWDGELVHTTRDQRRILVASRWAVHAGEGDSSAILEINRDITARKRAEDQVRTLNAELEQRVRELADANVEILQRNRESAAVNRAVLVVSQELQLAEVLQNIVDVARELFNCRFAALGVANLSGRIVQLVTSGITSDEREAIGALPQGHGLLRALIQEKTPLRISGIREDPRSHGFPPNHPPMQNLLGVPILLRGRAVGDLYLTEKVGAGEFSPDDQNLLMALAHHAAVAIENARLYEEARASRDLYQAANKELETFAYSVSHDLRAPLRHLDGFSQALLNGYGEQFDERGQRYLHHIRDAAQDMGQLIDALLRLARISQSEMRWERVNLSELVHAIRVKLEAMEPERQVYLNVADDVEVTGDPQLLQVLLENLLANAWKFTRDAALARIEFRVNRQDDEDVFAVLDNGAGFDMQYADKLFGPFQRLHSAAEFEGTGIGLATVQRIVHRHGGRVWAEGTVGEGAAFFFTLCPKGGMRK